MFLEKINIKTILLLVISSVILGFVYNSLSKFGIPIIFEEKDYEIFSESAGYQTTEPLLINLEQAIEFYGEKKVQFIDARDRWDFAESHILGAINIPEYSFDSRNFDTSTLDKNHPYVVYCEGDDCDTSKRLAEELIKLGYSKIFIYEGGFSEWTNLELPVDKK